MIKTPIFWYDKSFFSKLKAYLLIPLSIMWIIVSRIKAILSHPYKSKLKVVCIGNLTIGGTGKTPFAINVFKLLKNMGHNPAFLTRGYGGKNHGPLEVKSNHTHFEIGDEALLLSNVGTTIVSKNRSSGAKFIENDDRNFDVIIMDDGLQNNQLHKDINILLIDKNRIFGNEYCIPAGPLREPLSYGIKKINTIILTGNNEEKFHLNYKIMKKIPVFNSKIVIENLPKIKKNDVLAFCGLANPLKFYKTLEENKFNVIKTRTFPDHHKYTNEDIFNLEKEAKKEKLQLITTEKDYVKIESKNKNLINVLPINLILAKKDEAKFKSFLKDLING
jgi:tetraacyldisaccharide 4'-kinase